jgi:hypothetical protein
MTTNVTVPGTAISQGGLLEVGLCPRHGRPGVGLRQEKFGSQTPSWVIVIALFTLLVAAIVAESIRKRVAGPVPVCEECVRDKRTFRLQVAGLWIVDIVLVGIGLSGSAAALLGWLVLTVFALVYSFMSSRYRTQGTVSDDGLFVVLKQVDSAFASACRQRMSGEPAPPVSHGTVGTTILPGQ